MKTTKIEPKLGHIWVSTDPRDARREVTIVGITSTHVLVLGVTALRVRHDRFPLCYRFSRVSHLLPGEAVDVIDVEQNVYGVEVDQKWRACGDEDRVVVVVEVEEGFARVRPVNGTRVTRVRLSRFTPDRRDGYSRIR